MGSNGLTLDRDGHLVLCQCGNRQIARMDAPFDKPVPKYISVANNYNGKKFNSPNDVVIHSNGAVYFTDPTYGRIREELGVLRDPVLAFRGVYRIPPDRKDLQLLVDDFEQPNGLCFSIDETKLYVNDTVRGHIRVFDVSGDGTVKNGRIWATLVGEGVGVADGMKTDGQGHIYCTGPGGIHVFRPDAECLGVIHLSERPANFAWGGGDFRTLFVTASTSLYRLRTRVPGHRIGVNAIP